MSITSTLSYKLLCKLKPRRHSYFNELLSLKEEPAEQIKAEQKVLLDQMVLHAYKTVPFYRRFYDEAGLGEKLASGIVNIEALPILTKEHVRKYKDEMVSESVDKAALVLGKTGGSTGTPLEYYYDNESYERMWAVSRFFYSLSGWKPGQRVLHFWGARQDTALHKGLKIKLSEWLVAEYTIGAYEFDEKSLGEWYRQLVSYQPSVLQGYASILYEFAKYLQKYNKVSPPILGVYSTAEVLYPFQRQLIEEVFGCKVYNQYGCREIPGIACECSHGNMHCVPRSSFVESLPSATEDAGRLVITSLTNWSMPFIRYELGDFGDLKSGTCECGMPFPMMDMAVGRSNDIITLSNGRSVYPSYFVHLLDDVVEVSEYQFKQSAPDEIKLYVAGDYSADVMGKLNALGDRIKQDLNVPELKFVVEVVEQIPRTQAGKFRFVISDFQN